MKLSIFTVLMFCSPIFFPFSRAQESATLKALRITLIQKEYELDLAKLGLDEAKRALSSATLDRNANFIITTPVVAGTLLLLAKATLFRSSLSGMNRGLLGAGSLLSIGGTVRTVLSQSEIGLLEEEVISAEVVLKSKFEEVQESKDRYFAVLSELNTQNDGDVKNAYRFTLEKLQHEIFLQEKAIDIIVGKLSKQGDNATTNLTVNIPLLAGASFLTFALKDSSPLKGFFAGAGVMASSQLIISLVIDVRTRDALIDALTAAKAELRVRDQMLSKRLSN